MIRKFLGMLCLSAFVMSVEALAAVPMTTNAPMILNLRTARLKMWMKGLKNWNRNPYFLHILV